ncbi:hypothetical protein NLJ89_g7977 [Agrocybe chaxingu]|uniref:Nephrocystin 3-like N-terminal domain-containing protein n=1 Tax=Agrocybe chaxingu TaxID=84603 RepID=A0A9W8K2M2_9AGAR|nr:hypothetical protein NLJ89_g7977 [Agrocybe chaxingu]
MSAPGRRDVRFFEGAHYVSIAESSIRVETIQPDHAGFKGWQEIIATSAFHNSGERYDPPRCHPHTRKAILEKIMSWVRGGIDTEAFIFWLNGYVGVGKSAIGQTIAEMCEEQGLLLASFFFSRSDPTRNNAKSLVTTLAYQIGLVVLHARRRIEQAFEHDPVLHTRSLEAQALKLVIGPLQQASVDQIDFPPLIVIDGLDECIDPSMRYKILEMITRAGHSLRASGHRLIFLVGSRPDQEISLKFDSAFMRDITTYHSLGTYGDADSDIRHVLEDAFEEIKKTHPLKDSIPSSWPSSDDANKLVRRACGQFLYAHIAIDYSRNIRRHPINRLNEILALHAEQNNNPFADLDDLYIHLFSSLEHVDSVLKVLSFKLASIYFDTMISQIVRDVLALSFDDIRLIFGDLSSVVEVVRKPESGPGIWEMNFRHASLGEFLTNQHRSKQYFVNVEPSIAEWVSWILQNDLVNHVFILEGLSRSFKKLGSCKSQVLHDALRDCQLGLLLSKPSLQQYFPLGYTVYGLVTQIRMMAFEDAQELYECQLQVFEFQARFVLEQLYSQSTYIPLLLSSFTTMAFRSTDLALSYMLGQGRKEPDPFYLRRRIPSFQEWFSFLSALAHNPRRSVQNAVNGAKFADAAVTLIRLLCRPVPLTNVFDTFAQLTKPLKNHPWKFRRIQHSRFRMVPGKWFKWSFCDSCGKAHTPETWCWRGPELAPTLAYRASPRSPLILLHSSSELLAYRLALTFLPDMLTKAPRSAELIECSTECVFHPTSILFPRKSKIARMAMSEYLGRMDAEEHGWWLD